MSDAETLSTMVTQLIERLRSELHQYGEMMSLLDQQREHVMSRSAEEIMNSVGSINHQMTVIQKARELREELQQELGKNLERPDEPAFSKLIPLLPEKYQGAVETLVRETNLLLQKVQKRARQNHLLLSRSLELMQHFLASLSPAPPPTTYNETGHMAGKPSVPKQIYEAVG